MNRKIPTEKIEKMKQLKKEGMPMQKIADLMNVSYNAVQRHTNPKQAKRQRDYIREYMRKLYKRAKKGQSKTI